ncbi:hypothetical protein CDL12_16596 [Handroanthus impetiginosus]|uniref:Putative plant transposon protein domain-containing protein n=1 Tax=Handroanthus impetiginosus TaxID=429701 RepID=A0A2G9GZV1_9LAMI|nr:hypothetical protein CDL12_16596 [Handroanthus impetiginosus]
MVREFYANVKFNSLNNNRVLVRGATVDFSLSAINNLLGAPIVDEPNDFEAFIQHPPSWETISEILCAAPPNWILNVHNEPVGIPRSSLTNEAWDWLRFINARLYLSSHLSEVSKDRAIFLYFPSLVTALCRQEGLANLPGDELIQPDTTVNEENRALPPLPPPAHRRQRRPRELGLEDRLTHVEDGLHRLQLQHERHLRQCFEALYDHFQIPPDRRPQFAPDEPDVPDDTA